MASIPVKVKVQDERAGAERFKGLVDVQRRNLRSNVKEYMRTQSRGAEGDKVAVKIRLSEIEIKPGLGELPRFREQADMSVTGLFAGERFEFKKQHSLPVQIGTIDRSPSESEPLTPDDQTKHELLFEELMNLALEGFESAIGRGWTSIGLRWRAIKLVIVTLSLLVAAGIWYFCYSTGFITNPKAQAAVSFMFGFGTFFIGLTIGAACMPLEFFEEHAEGHRVMDFVNTDDPARARFLLRIGVVVLVLIALFMIFIYRTTFG
jgi:hypothetical protein